MLTRHHSGLWMRGGAEAKTDCWIIGSVLGSDEYHFVSQTRSMPATARMVDVGAQVGSASRKLKQCRGLAQVACVEMWEPHWEPLERNVAGFGRVFRAAAAYDQPTAMRATPGNSVRTHLIREGDSTVTRNNPASCDWRETELSVPTMTIEAVLDAMGWDRCEILKLDCEGSEHDILRHADMGRIGSVVTEWHGRPEWEATLEALPGWRRVDIAAHGHDMGVAWLFPR